MDSEQIKELKRLAAEAKIEPNSQGFYEYPIAFHPSRLGRLWLWWKWGIRIKRKGS